MASASDQTVENLVFRSTLAAFFLGVPHRGLHISALASMVRYFEMSIILVFQRSMIDPIETMKFCVSESWIVYKPMQLLYREGIVASLTELIRLNSADLT